MTIDYDHSANLHTRSGAEAGLAVVLGRLAGTPSSMIDVGCGTGTWLRAATMLGVPDVRGVDGVIAPADELEVARSLITQVDLTQPLPLDRTFDLALCLEVAEHLDAPCGGVLVDSLVRASRQVVFSAACPGQMGQHHVNCQWPLYWQAEFNARGFACSDDVRWDMWCVGAIEPWYRQNMFLARFDPGVAGKEPRLRSVIHPDMLPSMAVGWMAERPSLATRLVRRVRDSLR